MMRILTAVEIIACVACLCAVCGGQRSALFSAVQLAGRTQCSSDPPLVTLRTSSSRQCSLHCAAALGDGSCVAINFREMSTCELFFELTTNHTFESGCTLYQMQQEKNVDSCASQPCLHNGTCFETSNSYGCACPVFFSGAQCELWGKKSMTVSLVADAECDKLKQQAGPNTTHVLTALQHQVAVCENSLNTTWLVIQKRFDGSVNFSRNWTEYEYGFNNGSVQFGELWLGNFYLAQLTALTPYILLIELTDWAGVTLYAEYSRFVVGGAATKYKLVSLGSFSGTAGDGLSYHLEAQFNTYDVANEIDLLNGMPCAVEYSAGWWFNDCLESSLNGVYNGTGINYGIVWGPWRGNDYSLKAAEMKMRPVNF